LTEGNTIKNAEEFFLGVKNTGKIKKTTFFLFEYHGHAATGFYIVLADTVPDIFQCFGRTSIYK
jgi:hypothetical protein